MGNQNSNVRKTFKNRRKDLLQYLINLLPNQQNTYVPPESTIDLDDGGMRSISFGADKQRRFGKDLIQVKYTDADKTLVIITLIGDEQKNLFELEMWKVDFSELKQYPTPDKITLS